MRPAEGAEVSSNYKYPVLRCAMLLYGLRGLNLSSPSRYSTLLHIQREGKPPTRLRKQQDWPLTSSRLVPILANSTPLSSTSSLRNVVGDRAFKCLEETSCPRMQLPFPSRTLINTLRER